MENWTKIAIAMLGCAAGAVGGVWVLVRFVIQRKLEQHFVRIEALVAKQMALNQKAAEFFLDKELTGYPAIAQLVYKAKTTAEEALRARNVFELANSGFLATCRELTAHLHGFRVYLPDETWKLLHEYKHAVQDLFLICDIATRNDIVKTGGEIPADTKEKVARCCAEIARQCDTIMPLLRERMRSLQGNLKEQEVTKQQ